MKPIPRYIIKRYMSVLVQITRNGVEHIHADSPEMSRLYSRDDFKVVLDYLCSADLISLFEASEMAPIITLTDKGAIFLEDSRDACYRFIMNSIIVPILVSIVTAFITVYILPSVGKRAEQWFHMPQQNTEQSVPAPAPADGPSENT